MTQDEKLQAIVEAAGEKWQTQETRYGSEWVALNPKVYEYKYPEKVNNPSPTDLNELFRLAIKIGVVDLAFGHNRGRIECVISGYAFGTVNAFGSTYSEALTNSIYRAVKE